MANIAQDEEFLNLLPSKWWVKFFKKFDEIDTVPEHEWEPVHLLAHFCRRYQRHFEKRFSFGLKGSPSKCPEVFQIKQVMAVLGTSNQVVVREYIDWIFDIKIIPANKKIRSIGFMANSSYCNEFHLYRQEKKKINRTTEIPEDYKKVVDELGLPVRTFGDLAFAKQAVDTNPRGREAYERMFDKLYAIGFEYQMLQGLR
jgi:hypothetical protein